MTLLKKLSGNQKGVPTVPPSKSILSQEHPFFNRKENVSCDNQTDMEAFTSFQAREENLGVSGSPKDGTLTQCQERSFKKGRLLEHTPHKKKQ